MKRTIAMRMLLGTALVLTIPGATLAQDPTPEGTEWHLVNYSVRRESAQVPWNVDATLMLEAGQASGSAGCNAFGGEYKIDGEALTFSGVGLGSDVACPEGTIAVEAGFMAALPTTASWAFDTSATGRTLLLRDAAGDITLSFQEPTAGLTVADVAALTSLLDAQQDQIDRLTRQLTRLRDQVQ